MSTCTNHARFTSRQIYTFIFPCVVLLFMYLMSNVSASAQTTTWIYDGGGNWSTDSNWDAGAPAAGSLVVIDEGDWPVQVVLDVNPKNPISGLTIGSDDSLVMQNFVLPFNAGSTIINDGEIQQLALISSASTIRFSGDATVTGTGVWTLSDRTFNYIVATTGVLGAVLTQEAGHTIHGGGTIGNQNMGMINFGLVEADNPYATNNVALNIAPGTAIDIGATDVDTINHGTFSASKGGRLILRDGVFDNTGGTIQAIDADSIVVIESAEVRDGDLVTDAVGRIMPSNNSLLTDVTVTAGSTVQINNISTAISGTITNNGTIYQIAGTFSVSAVEVTGDVTIDGSGAWQTTNNSLNRINGTGNNVLTNGADHTFRGTPQLGGKNLGLINNGTIIADEPYATTGSRLMISPGLGVNINGGDADAINYGTLRSENAAILHIRDGEFENFGIVEALDGSHVEIDSSNWGVTLNNQSGTLVGGTWRAISSGSGALLMLSGNNITQIASGTVVEIAGTGSVVRVNATPIENTLTGNAGELIVGNGRLFVLANALNNTGRLSIDAASRVDMGANDITSSGALEVGLDSSSAISKPAVKSTGTATLAGSLVVSLESGFEPGVGDVIQIIDAGSVVGAFDDVTWPVMMGSVGLGLEYQADAVLVRAGLPGDLGNDSFVGLSDLDIVLTNWNQNVTAGVWLEGDPSGDGFVGLDDLDIILQNWNAGSPPATTVPEPGSVFVLSLLALMPTCRRR